MKPYNSPLEYNAERIHAAAVYCSDGRVGEHFDDFLHNGLQLPRYDRVALPGGPACLAGHTETHLEEQGVVDELKFMVDAHQLSRVVLIAHQACAFYTQRLRLPPKYHEAQQQIDLVKAAAYIRELTGIWRVDAYYAKTEDRRISFAEVPVT